MGHSRQRPGDCQEIVCEAVIGWLGRFPGRKGSSTTQVENQARDGAAVEQASLEDVEVKVARELSAYGWSEWMRPSTRALTFGRAV